MKGSLSTLRNVNILATPVVIQVVLDECCDLVGGGRDGGRDETERAFNVEATTRALHTCSKQVDTVDK